MDQEQKKDDSIISSLSAVENVPKKKDSYFDIIKFTIVVLIIFVPIRLWVAKPFIVSGDSMYPTFKNSQYLIVDQISYDLQKPKRDDVIVFKYPYDPSQKTYYIKRIIGLPGDQIASKDGRITVVDSNHPNGFALKEPYVVNASYDDFSTTTLSDNEYFVMGDNRPASSDSRIWGVLKDTYIVGRPLIRLWPPTTISFLPGGYGGNPTN